MRFSQLILGIALLAGFSTASHASKVTVSPDVCTALAAINGCATSNVNGGNDVNIFPVLDILQYNWDVSAARDSGRLWQTYETAWITEDSESEVSGLTIYRVSGTKVSCAPNPCYLVVKGGAQQPARYLFNLAMLGWEGEDHVTLENFWLAPDKGEISHAAIFTGMSPVPVPGAAWLFGTALIGFVGLSRRTKV